MVLVPELIAVIVDPGWIPCPVTGMPTVSPVVLMPVMV